MQWTKAVIVNKSATRQLTTFYLWFKVLRYRLRCWGWINQPLIVTYAKIMACQKKCINPNVNALRYKSNQAQSQKQKEIAERVEKSKALIGDGLTQRAAAEVLGVSHDTIAKDCKRNIVITEKILQKPKRKVDGYRITQYTKPTTAAEKIIDKFGVEFSI